MNDFSKEILDVIRYATKMEISGRSFYEHAAEMTKNEYGKQVFKKLAQDEIDHIETFGDIFTNVLGNEEWKQYIDQEEEDKKTVLNQLKARVEKQAHQDRASDQEALRIGMELERGSIDQYKKWATNSDNTKIKEIFEKIIKEEKYHYDLLQAEYDNITNTGFWFDMAEFRMDGKF